MKFAVVNYFNGGRSPAGLIGVGVPIAATQLDEAIFADPGADKSLHYVVPQAAE